MALTPPPAHGKRQIRDEDDLVNTATVILKAHDVEDFLTYTFERQEKRESKYIGRGRGNPARPTREIVTVRCQITAVFRQEEAIAARQKTLGGRAYASDALAELLSLEQAVLTYRDEWIIERDFHRLKGVPLSQPIICQERRPGCRPNQLIEHRHANADLNRVPCAP